MQPPNPRSGEGLAVAAAAELMCKTVMVYASTLAQLEDFDGMLLVRGGWCCRWARSLTPRTQTVLGFLERFKLAGAERFEQGDADGALLSETASELAKNLVLGLGAERVLGLRLDLASGAVVDAEDLGSVPARRWAACKLALKAGPLKSVFVFFPDQEAAQAKADSAPADAVDVAVLGAAMPAVPTTIPIDAVVDDDVVAAAASTTEPQ
jgi:hypothetical protein